MTQTNYWLIKDLNHNRKLLKTIYQSGLSIYYNTDAIHDAIDAIIDELRRRGFTF
ncbi:hypothetical protein LLI29_002912 [Morganella morganii]|nr:hypothetical protein [Morganella morganii]EKU8061844.1 hypothetical protein [Morganella morganii]EKW8498926.1 hypothetical protein [Morganella morganii]ELB1287859.1 hypothetical protein [Morganella morganii]